MDYLRNPKVASLPDVAVVLHLELILWCKEQGTNGSIPSHMRRRIGIRIESRSTHARAWKRLIDGGFLIEEPDGWTLTGFDERNGNESSRQAAKAYERDRKREQRKSAATS